MKHVRILANLGFWRPCIKAFNANEQQLEEVGIFQAALARFLPISGEILQVQVTDIPTTPTVTVHDVHTH